jgi:biotin-(acetyl-CoA carboxylase) ligase
MEICFDVSRRSREMQRRVDNTRNVIYVYCHCMSRMVSYPGITRKVRVRLKWPVDIYVQDLQFMTAGWRKKLAVTPFRLQ